MEMYVFVVVYVGLIVASGSAQGKLHGAAGVGYFMNKTLFIKGIQGAVEGNPIKTIRKLLFQLRLGNGMQMTQHKIQNGNPAIGKA
jgi:hypothetical protein